MNDKKYEITIRNWDKYQREMKGGERRRRRRDWIAISTDLFSDPCFFEMDQCHRNAWVGLLCHAGKVGPVFELCPSTARVLFQLRKSPDFEVFKNQGFIELRAATYKTRHTRHTRQDITPAKKKAKKKTGIIPADTIDIEELKAIYPKRMGGNPWVKAAKAISARIKEGHSWSEISDGIRRYSAFCEHTGKIGTEYVKQAATFCGPDKCFSEPWDLPRNKAEVKQDKNEVVLQGWLSGGSA